MDIQEYIEQHSSPQSDLLQRIAYRTHVEMINPRMMSGHIQGRVLSMLSQMIQPTRILELGTFTGYSALCLAEGLTPDGELISLEHNDELEDMIRRNWALSPIHDKLHLLIGDAIESLHQLAHTHAQAFDLVFIDADKREYSTYLDLVLPLLRPGGWILADNTLWDGHIIDPAYDHDKQTIALRNFNDKVAQDERLQKVILPLRDGLTIIRLGV
jgi:predicted O-methyltransferase YrrM